MLSVTVIGDLQGKAPLLRSGAQPNDAIIFAGQVGYSPAGLELLLQDVNLDDIPESLQPIAKRALDAYRVPLPPLKLGPIAAGYAHAMIDVSDGLERDGGKLASYSHQILVLDPETMAALVAPLRPLAEFLKVDPWTWVMCGGEDHGLLGTCPPEALTQLVPVGFQVLGKVVSPDSDDAKTSASEFKKPGLYLGEKRCQGGGWDHFAS